MFCQVFRNITGEDRKGRHCNNHSKSMVFELVMFMCLLKAACCILDSCPAYSVARNSPATSEAETLKSIAESMWRKKRSYLLYDVNPGEGFNLRRDVYMRMANLVKKIRGEKPNANWILVLPPWGPLYHWKRSKPGQQNKIPWSAFFDLPSLSKYIPVIEFEDFLKEHGPKIDQIYYLQHYEEGWTDGVWEERIGKKKCIDKPPYKETSDGKIIGRFWGYDGTFANALDCLSVQGSSSTLKRLLLNASHQAIMIDRAEVVLHDAFGNHDYWMVRRSMRFAKNLVDIGNNFRLKYLNSSDKLDKTEQSDNWMSDTVKTRSAVGGPYIAVHLRRRDFLKARPFDVPSIKHAAQQIKSKMTELKLTSVFVATDAYISEITELKKDVPHVIRFHTNDKLLAEIKDGGIAVVDQWICAHARYFIGTHESTFSFRIQEEREILGFPVSATFNRLCGDNQTTCKQPAVWKIDFV